MPFADMRLKTSDLVTSSESCDKAATRLGGCIPRDKVIFTSLIRWRERARRTSMSHQGQCHFRSVTAPSHPGFIAVGSPSPIR